MRRHPGLDPENYSGSDAFYSDANLDRRARGASYEDFAPGPSEATGLLLGSGDSASPSLRAHAAMGGAITPLQLAEFEIDEGGRSADLADTPQYAAPAPFSVPYPPTFTPHADTSRLDRLEAAMERLINHLGDK